jgi:quercetin dioxygenase-like cupin family protein
MTLDATDPAAAETLWVVQDRLTLHGRVEGSGLDMIEVEIPPGSGTPPHTHASPETFLVLEGEIRFGHFAGPPREIAGRPGTCVKVGSMEPHNYRNPGPAPARMLVLLEPSMTAFFRDIGRPDRPAEGAPPDFAAIGAAMARHGIGLVEMAA